MRDRFPGPRFSRRRSLLAITASAAVAAALIVPAGPSAASTSPASASAQRQSSTAPPVSKAAGCDPIGTSQGHCLLPFPNNWFTKKDRRTKTKRRVSISTAMMPKNAEGKPIDPAEFNRNDGFSPSSPILANIPGLDLAKTKAAPITDMARSLRNDAPIALINTRTGKRHPYWAELDSNATDPKRKALIIRPARNLDEGVRYAVALRGLRDSAGKKIAPSSAFKKMLKKKPPRDKKLKKRWKSMKPVLKDLRRAGISKKSLNLAWDFTTSSTYGISSRVLHMRDQSFKALKGDSPKAVVTEVKDTWPSQDPLIARRVKGYVEVPSYLDKDDGPAGSRLHYKSAKPGPTELPSRNGDKIIKAKFQCIVPHKAFTKPARPLLFGHGLFGNEGSVEGMKTAAAEHNVIPCGAAFTGLSSDDLGFLLGMVKDFSAFPAVPDRMQQAYLGFLFLGRAMIHRKGMRALPAFDNSQGKSLLDGSAKLTYAGISLGGIQGTAVTALSQDFRRSLLGVPATNFSTLMHRSKLFAPFFGEIIKSYPDRLDHQLMFSAAQLLWDRGEGAGYVAHVTKNPLPKTPRHKVLMHEAYGDQQVANVATEVAARTMGVRVHQPALKPGRSPDVTPFWGIKPIPDYPYDGSALVMWDSGSPAPPLGNLPPTQGHDPHGDPHSSEPGRLQAFRFLVSGEVADVCEGKPCEIPPAS